MTQIDKVLKDYKVELDSHSAQLSALRAENAQLKSRIDELGNKEDK
ncbi:MAG: hypothetical protein ACRCXR_11420 [Weissella cibaria]